MSNNAAANAALSSATSTAGAAGNTIVVGNVVVNLFLSGSLSLLWGMINALQIIANIPLLQVMMPANAKSFYTFIINIANFKIIDTDMITGYFVTKTDSSNNTDSSISNSNFESQGINSANIVENLGPIFLVMLVGVLLAVVLVLLYVFRKSKFVQLIYDEIYHMLFWNSSLRFVLEGYLNLMMSSLIQIQAGLSWDNFGNIVTSAYTIFIVVLSNITPASVSFYLNKNFAKFIDEKFVKRFEYTK